MSNRIGLLTSVLLPALPSRNYTEPWVTCTLSLSLRDILEILACVITIQFDRQFVYRTLEYHRSRKQHEKKHANHASGYFSLHRLQYSAPSSPDIGSMIKTSVTATQGAHKKSNSHTRYVAGCPLLFIRKTRTRLLFSSQRVETSYRTPSPS